MVVGAPDLSKIESYSVRSLRSLVNLAGKPRSWRARVVKATEGVEAEVVLGASTQVEVEIATGGVVGEEAWQGGVSVALDLAIEHGIGVDLLFRLRSVISPLVLTFWEQNALVPKKDGVLGRDLNTHGNQEQVSNRNEPALPEAGVGRGAPVVVVDNPQRPLSCSANPVIAQGKVNPGPLLPNQRSWSSVVGGQRAGPPLDRKLQFIPPTSIDGVKTAVCPAEEIDEGAQLWENSLVGAVMGEKTLLDAIQKSS